MSVRRIAVFAIFTAAAFQALAQSEACGLFDDYGATPGDAAAPRDLEPRWRVALGGGLGMNLFRGSGWRLGASLSPSRGRKESDDAHASPITETRQQYLVFASAACLFR